MIGRPFSFDIAQDGRVQVFHGVLEDDAVEHLHSLFVSGPADDLTVDLAEVDFMGSIAIGALAKAQLRARGLGRELRVVTSEGSIAQRVLTITGVPHETTDGEQDA